MYFHNNIYDIQVAFLKKFNDFLKEQKINQTQKIESVLKSLKEYKEKNKTPSVTVELDFLDKRRLQINTSVEDKFNETLQDEYPLKLYFITKENLTNIFDLCEDERFTLNFYKTHSRYNYNQYHYIFYILNNNIDTVIDMTKQIKSFIKNKT